VVTAAGLVLLSVTLPPATVLTAAVLLTLLTVTGTETLVPVSAAVLTSCDCAVVANSPTGWTAATNTRPTPPVCRPRRSRTKAPVGRLLTPGGSSVL
jgi:hypothetical protein